MKSGVFRHINGIEADLSEEEKKKLTESVLNHMKKTYYRMIPDTLETIYTRTSSGLIKAVVSCRVRKMGEPSDDFSVERAYLISNSGIFLPCRQSTLDVAEKIFRSPRLYLKTNFKKLDEYDVYGAEYLKALLDVAQHGLMTALDVAENTYVKLKDIDQINTFAVEIKNKFEKEYGITKTNKVEAAKKSIKSMTDLSGEQMGE